MGNYISGYLPLFSANSASTKRVYGYIKDKEDMRDFYHNFVISHNHNLIQKVDLTSYFPPVYDQGQLGSCTANAIAGAYEYDEKKENENNIFTPSRLFIYYNERVLEGTVEEDSGASLRDGIKTINKIGVCPESMWPYDIDKFTDKPSNDCYNDAKNHHAVEYKRVKQSLSQMRQCLIEGFPFVFGFTVFESFESPTVNQTGIMPMPKQYEKILGGHAVCVVGYDDNMTANGSTGFMFVRNSWGSSWGLNGYFWMPYDFITNREYCNDFWTIKKVVDDEKQH